MSKTKMHLSPPAVPDLVLDRPEVNRAIGAAMAKDVVFFRAPAGFGKTLAMSMWLQKNSAAAAWIALTVYDDRESIFCRYLLKALSALDSGAAAAARAALDDPGFDAAPFEYFFKAVSAISSEGADGVIVLDDFHLIKNESIIAVLPSMIRKLAPVYKFAFLSRLSPPASFSDLALKGRIGEVTDDDLRFTSKQIIGLYKGCGIELSPADALEAESKTGGWALGLAARLLAVKTDGPGRLSQASGERYISHYLKNEIWDKWDEATQSFLLRSSILEDLPPQLCDLLCGCDSTRVLIRLMNDSGLIVCLSDGCFRYHHILRDFLRQMAQERQMDLSSCYIAAAAYMRKNGHFIEALDYYVKSKDYVQLSAFLLKEINYNFLKLGSEDYYFSFKTLVLDKVPMAVMENSAPLVSVCAYMNWLSGNAGQMEFWFSRAKSLLCTASDIETVATLLSILFLDPLISPWEFTDLLLPEGAALDVVPSISLTMNLPFFHRALRDYSDSMANWESLLAKLRLSFQPILRIYTDVMVDGISSGILFEQNKLARAKDCALRTLGRLTEQLNPELFFAVYMHIAAILFAEGDAKEAWTVMGKAQALVESSALYLKKNLAAMMTKYRLYEGDLAAARQCLSSQETNGSSELHLYQIFQAFTTVRAQIALGEFSPALILLTRLETLAQNCRRPLDRLEALILKAIVLWKQRQREGSVDIIKEAVLLAQPCGYVRMFANEGAAVLPLLQKLYNAAAHPEADALTGFIRELIFATSETAKHSPGIAAGLEDQLVRLSKQQKRILNLLAAGLNNRQICEQTGLKLNTVKAHLFKLYEKLDVNNATDAVLKARRLNLLLKSE